MRAGVIHHASGLRRPKPLVVRGGLARTFGGLAGFIVVTFLCWGLYILEDAFSNPRNAGAAPVISAAFIIAVAAMLLFFLVKPGKRSRTTSHEHALDSASPAALPFGEPPPGEPVDRSEPHDNLRNNLPYQRFFVDHFRIRP
jgi:hypothetical protein